MDHPSLDDAARRAAHVPALASSGALRPLGHGADHAAFAAGDDLVVRVRLAHTADAASAIEREAALLELVAQVSPLPVPEVVATHPDEGVLVLRRLDGVSLLDSPSTDPLALVEPLASFIAALAAVPPERVAGLVHAEHHPLVEYLDEVSGFADEIAPFLGHEEVRMVEAFLAASPPPTPAPPPEVFCHADLGAEHLLAAPDRRTLTGVIDWSDSARTDPAWDLGRLHRDLGPHVARGIAAQLSFGDATLLERAAFVARGALLEDLAYGYRSGDRRYVDAARRNLVRTFASDR